MIPTVSGGDLSVVIVPKADDPVTTAISISRFAGRSPQLLRMSALLRAAGIGASSPEIVRRVLADATQL
jgi:hypothetical protein